MPELENQVVQPVVPETKEANVIPEASPVESQARESGWVPKEEFEGDEHKWVDAGEFLRRGELFKKIEAQNKELKDVKKTLQLLAQHNAKIKDIEFKRAIDYLKEQKKEALIEGDADAVVQLDEKIDEAKEQHKAAQIEAERQLRAEVAEVHPEFQAWTERNTWYTSSGPMKAFADAVGSELAAKGLRPSEVLKEVEKQVRAEFPQRFKNPNREKPGAVEGASTKGSTKSGSYQPTDFERQVAKKFVKAGVFANEQEYYKQLEGKS